MRLLTRITITSRAFCRNTFSPAFIIERLGLDSVYIYESQQKRVIDKALRHIEDKTAYEFEETETGSIKAKKVGLDVPQVTPRDAATEGGMDSFEGILAAICPAP